MAGSLSFDVREYFPAAPPVVIEVCTAFSIVALTTLARLTIDFFSKDVIAFPLIFPAVVLATIVAGGRCGLLVIAGCQLLAWYFLLPVRNSFVFASAGDAISLALATGAQLLLLGCVARYRGIERRAAALLEAQERDLKRTAELLRQQAALNEQLVEQKAAVQATRQNLEAIYQASGDGLALCEAIFDSAGHVIEYQVLEVNRAHAELTAATREQMLTQKVSTIYPPIDSRWFDSAEKALKTGIPHDFDIRSRANGRWLNIRVSRVSDTLFQQTFVDISDRRRLEDQRQALLKEMSHRVMNNFQMIAGFLHLQASSSEPVVKEQLKTAERRIQVLANLHSLLAYAESEGDIDASAYVKQLCGYLGSVIERPEDVTLICEAGDLQLPPEKIVPLGFVVSELVTNSAKYAYPAPLSGVIRVSLVPDPDGWTLTISDDGQGFSEDKPQKKISLGTKLVARFVKQIGAELRTTSDAGVHHVITFRKVGPKGQAVEPTGTEPRA